MNNPYRSNSSSWSPSGIMRNVATAWGLFRDPRVPTALKVLIPLGALAY